MKAKYKVIGLMSGTSLDGLDIAYCVFQKLKSGWRYTIEKCETIRYSPQWLTRLSEAHSLRGEELMALDAAYGSYLGKTVRDFVQRHGLKVDFICSHGHTVFHQPAKAFTTQIGNGYSILAASDLPVVCDFRMEDVAFGGEGAPLVPAGDKWLFHEYDVCLNLGGIANLSLDVKGKRNAFDICFCNMGLNYLAAEISKRFDKNGDMASDGNIDSGLLKALDKVYKKLRSKRPSLGRELFEEQFEPLLEEKKLSLEDRLCTFTESAAIEITEAIKSHRQKAKVLCTGGGAFNSYLISRMLQHGGDDLTFIIPEEEVVKFKEAMVFGFLGVLRVRNEVNCLKTVTKASRDSSSGTMIGF
ncbi:MAG TPA: anhydro-N-acetylmuramic acid kinase [Chryseosolibacter sp.]|nr:anhydro-N-acetylmuramic acid kinase [Chryseosolibacter sp.]